MTELDDWSKIRLLTVQINRLRDWCREGLLCIGDAAHAMSPDRRGRNQSGDSRCRGDSEPAGEETSEGEGFAR